MRKEFTTKKGLFVAVDGVSIDVEPNTLVALLGPSGSGAPAPTITSDEWAVTPVFTLIHPGRQA